MSGPAPTDLSQQLHKVISQAKNSPPDAPSTLGALSMGQPPVPSSGVVHRSTVLNIDQQNPIPANAETTGIDTLQGASIPPELYYQLGIMQATAIGPNTAAAAHGGGGYNPAPGMSYAQLGSMFAMAGIPLPDELEEQQGTAPVSETARKEAAAAARAARQAKRREEKLRQQERQRKTSNDPRRGAGAGSGEEGCGAPAPRPRTSRAAAVVATTVPVQPSSSQQVPSSLQQEGKRTAGTEDRSGLRAIKNRESAARSRAKRVEYTSALEAQVEQLRSQNKTLRTRVIATAAAPPDPHAGQVDGQPLRRTRTMPL